MNEINIIQQQNGGDNGEITAHVYSIIGNRNYQQDYAGIIVDPERVLAVICDGMGGMNGGETASKEATNVLISSYLAEQDSESVSDFFCREAKKMDETVANLKNPDGTPMKAGSTVVSVIIREGQMYWLSVGDSRIYLLRDGSMVPVTRDHNYRRELDEMLEKGTITQEYYLKEATGRRAEALTSYLGMGGLRRIECNMRPFPLEDGDIILLCSDGLYKSLDECQIRAMIEDNQISLEIATRRLVKMALQQAVKKQDNTTAILIRYHAGEKEITDGTML